MPIGNERIVIVGAGVGGLVAALLLATRGLDVTVVERAARPGGKLRRVTVGGDAADGTATEIDAGPTVFTLRGIFEEIFTEAGAFLNDHLVLQRVDVLARHAWSDGERLDLFAEPARSADAVGDFAGAAAAHEFRAFCARARQVYDVLEPSYLRAQCPSLPGLMANTLADSGWRGLGRLARISPFQTLWSALGDHFSDPRLRQLFARYATYCGSSPFAAPATLMLVAHVEQAGVWTIEGGMQRLADALAGLAERRGARLRYGTEVTEVLAPHGRVDGVALKNGERVPASAVIVNADAAAVAAGLLGPDIAPAGTAMAPRERSLSAVTWALSARADGFPLHHHNVFFSRDYAAEFEEIFDQRRLPRLPTVYVCAQDRHDGRPPPPGSAERLFCLVNAPPCGDTHPFDATEIETCAERTFRMLARCGLQIDRRTAATAVTTPSDFARLFPGTGGALYGRASHGWRACFSRPGAKTRLPGLYLAGGSAHPGAGLPMAALSGKLAAMRLLQDLPSRATFPRAAMPGGISTR